MNERIKCIISAGITAPSGDNCQPWRFETADDRIDIYNLPECDTSLYNYQQRASLVALGACIENMLIAAPSYGYRAKLCYFPTPGSENHVASLRLVETAITEDPLFPGISTRGINRKPFKGGELSAQDAGSIRQAATSGGVKNCSLQLLHGVKKAALADVVALSDRLVFENPLLHRFLFRQIRWSPEQAVRTGDGLDIRTLELAPPDRLLFPLLKYFKLVKFVSKFGATRMIAANARKLMLSASAGGVITIADSSPRSWVEAGRMLERAWLETNRQGLAFHLMTGITLLIRRVRDAATEGLEADNISLLKKADALLTEISGAEYPVALLFRIGKASPPSARSLRLAARTQDIA